jgi:flagellar basal-body rod modification protein FlgD
LLNSISKDTAGTAPATSAAYYMKKTTGLNKDDFMKLFITQLKYQDPTAPQDSSAMVAQMAQLTQVEQSYNVNTNLQNILSALNGSSNLSAVSFIGKTITAQGTQVNLSPGSMPQLNFSLDQRADKVQVAIQDPSGRTVKTMALGNTPAGEGSFTWDGKNDANGPLLAGIYSFTVTGINQDGSTFSGTPLVKGGVDGLKLVQGKPVLSAGGIDVPLANVIRIN